MKSKHIAAATLLAASAAGTACGPMQVRADSELPSVAAARQAPILVMAEPEFNFDHISADEYIRAYQLVEVLAESHDVPVVAPWEIAVAPGETWPFGQEHVERVMESNGLDLADVLLLRMRIDQQGADRYVSAPAGFPEGTTSSSRPDVTVELTIEHATSHEVYATVSVKFVDDGMRGELSEPRPLLREAIEKAGNRMGRFYARAFKDGGDVPAFAGVYNGRQMFDYDAGPGEPLAALWNDSSPAQRQVERFPWYLRLEPSITPPDAAWFDTVDPGVLISSVDGELADAGLHPGDYVLAVNRRPALGTHTIERAFVIAHAGEAVRLDVLRRGQVEVIRVPR